MKRLQEHWAAIVEKYDCNNTHLARHFTLGFLVGIAEKVNIGACAGAMASPERKDAAWVSEMVETVAAEYELLTYEIPRLHRIEYWFLANAGAKAALVESPDDNILRGMLCGVAMDKINPDHILEAPIGIRP